MKLRTQYLRRIAVMAAALSVLAACGGKPPAVPGGAGAPPPPQVGVVTVAPQPVAFSTELPGRLEASRVAEVRARAAGIVLERKFQEGSEVKAGQVLYRIDPAPMRAALGSAEAALAKAEANLTLARLKADRYKPLIEKGVVSRQSYDDVIAARDQAEAEVAAAKAARETARLNLGYATVTAPIAGRIGRALVTEGALVGQGEPTPLATIQQIDPIYLNLTQSSAEALQLRRALADGKAKRVAAGEAQVTLITEDGEQYPHPGRLLFSDLSVDPGTGVVTVRVLVPNPERALLPGMYVRARLEQGVQEGAILVPHAAVSHNPRGQAQVMLVNGENKVEARIVKAERSVGDKWVVSEGLAAGDRVIVEGLQRARPGTVVEAQAAGSQAAAASKAPPGPTAAK